MSSALKWTLSIVVCAFTRNWRERLVALRDSLAHPKVIATLCPYRLSSRNTVLCSQALQTSPNALFVSRLSSSANKGWHEAMGGRLSLSAPATVNMLGASDPRTHLGQRLLVRRLVLEAMDRLEHKVIAALGKLLRVAPQHHPLRDGRVLL